MELTEFKEPTLPNCSGEYLVTVVDVYCNIAFESYAYYQSETKIWTLFQAYVEEGSLDIKIEKQSLNGLLKINGNLWMIVDYQLIKSYKGRLSYSYQDRQLPKEYIDKCYSYLMDNGYMKSNGICYFITLDDFTEAKKVKRKDD